MLTVPADEARVHLLDLAHGKLGPIPPARVVEHVLRITSDGDWPVRRAAMQAIVRRFESCKRDAVGVRGRVPRSALGTFRTASYAKGRQAAVYTTVIAALDPLETSCDCPDFVKSALGLCKHGLAILELIETLVLKVRARPTSPTLRWDPITPTSGSSDRLARLRWAPARRARPRAGFDDRGQPTPEVLGDLALRLKLIASLQRGLRAGTLTADPSVPRLLEEERSRAERRQAAESRAQAGLRALSSLRRELYPYQLEGVTRFLRIGRLLLADDMGLGKTTQAIAACHALARSGAVKRGLLIVPAALKYQWRREWVATTDAPLTLVEGSPEERARIYATTRTGFLMIGYEQLLRDLEPVRRFGAEVVVLDEAQRIKNWATKSATQVKALNPRYRLVLTGTPMENRLDELSSLMDFVDDLALEPRWRLTPFHSAARGDGGSGVGGARNLNLLRERLSGALLRRVRKDVLAQLPARTDTRVPVEFTAVQRSHHEDLDRPVASLMAIADERPLTQPEFLRLMSLMTKQRIICNGLALLNFEELWPELQHVAPTPDRLAGLFAPKLSAFRGLVDQVALTQRRKMVVFSGWRRMLRLAEWSTRDLLASAGQRAVFFTGAESNTLRERAIVDFHDDPQVSVMFLSDAGGVGLNLQRAASCCINLELPWNPAVLEQRIARIYRLGQTLPIDVYNLVSEDGLEAHIARVVARKKAVFTSLFDGTSDEVSFDGSASFMETVRELTAPVVVPALASGEAPEPNLDEVEGLVDAPLDAPADAPVDAPARANLDVLASMRLTHLPDGGVRIEAPPAMASALADLFESFARTLRAEAETHLASSSLPS